MIVAASVAFGQMENTTASETGRPQGAQLPYRAPAAGVSDAGIIINHRAGEASGYGKAAGERGAQGWQLPRPISS